MKNNNDNELNIKNKNTRSKKLVWIIITIIIICILGGGAFWLINNEPKGNAENTRVEDDNECISNQSDEDTKNIGVFDWNNIKLIMNEKEYSFPIKVSDLINNGWTVRQEYQELLDKTTNSIIEEMKNPDSIYEGFNPLYFEQDNLILSVYIDLNNKDIKVIDAKITTLSISKKDDKQPAQFNFNGFEFGMKLIDSEFKRIFGNQNYEVTENDSFITYRYHNNYINVKNYKISLDTDICTTEIQKVSIDIFTFEEQGFSTDNNN